MRSNPYIPRRPQGRMGQREPLSIYCAMLAQNKTTSCCKAPQGFWTFAAVTSGHEAWLHYEASNWTYFAKGKPGADSEGLQSKRPQS